MLCHSNDDALCHKVLLLLSAVSCVVSQEKDALGTKFWAENRTQLGCIKVVDVQIHSIISLDVNKAIGLLEKSSRYHILGEQAWHM